MIGSPLALLGLLAVAVPVLIHLLGRYRSRVERFPTLRFIGTSRLNPTSRRRISDWPLLLVRMAIVAAAALALSQPLFHRAPATSSDLSRVVIVDSSASLARPIAADTFSGTHVMTASPDDAIPGAVAWLATRPGRREIVLVSDFQRSSIDTATLAAIPRTAGLRIQRAEGKRAESGEPTPRAEGHSRAEGLIGTLAGPGDLPGADDAWRAVGRTLPPSRPPALGVHPERSKGPSRITLIYRGYPAAPSLLRAAKPVDSLWMARLIAALRSDPALLAAGRGTSVAQAGRADLDHITPAIVAGQENGRLLLFLYEDAGSLLSAALNQALVRATAAPSPGPELDTTTWSPAQLAKWEREPTASPTRTSGASDAPWLWALCLLLIALETWMRRRAANKAAEQHATAEHADAPEIAA